MIVNNRTYYISQLGVKTITILLLLFLSFQSFSQKRLTRKEKKKITYLLDSLCAEDQKYRIPILYGTMDIHKIDSMQKLDRTERIKIYKHSAKSDSLKSFRDSLFNLMSQNDPSHFKFAIQLIDSIGFPSFYKHEFRFLLVLEHSIPDNPTYLDTLKQLMFEKKVSPWDYSMIYDRYRHITGEKLVYYTRKKYKGMPCNVCCEANKARKEIGIKKMMKCDCDD